ncbi:MAG: hypothetical protein IPJ14_23260 [Kineosporiaceae bacterium]|nr:hypothetical protein [Kineosporiaceae bacterium]MBK7625494.1 hypothetical protein [Kineosporiaceae bacterium]MBK8076143.1 hypothetical protein [Kineosporiaceae bacterium]
MTDPTALPAFVPTAGQPMSQPLSQPMSQPEPTPQPVAATVALRDLVVEALSSEGFRPEIDEDGDVVVRVSGQPMFLRCFETAPPMMRVWSQWMLDDAVPGDELMRLRAANAMTAVLNLIKVTLMTDRLVVAVDLTVHPAMDLRTLLTATLEAVRDGVTSWHGTLVQLLEEQEAGI